MRPKVKFCGMTREEDIHAAEELHVDFVGFVFVPSSPRSVTLHDVKRIRSAVQRAKTVGVFIDHSVEEIERHVEVLQLDFVQLHGKLDIERVRHLSKPVVQAFRGVPEVATAETFLKHCPYILIDKAEGQNEADFDLIAALPPSIRSKLFLAGGLTPGNVRSAVDRVQPYAVDCARGIESSPRVKNFHRMCAFFQALSS